MIFKNSNIIIFQSPFQAKLFMHYNIDIFVDGTFKNCTKNVVINRSLLELMLRN